MSFLKQLLSPFVEFEEEKKTQTTKPNQSAPVAPKNATTTPISAQPAAPVQPVQHPLVNTSIPIVDDVDIPAYSPSGVITEPLPEHKQYFEKLIDQANRTNPLFHGADYKEFIDSKVDIDDITDENLKYQTAYNILKSSGLTKQKLLSTGQEYLNIIGRDLNAFQGAHSQQFKKELGQKQTQVQKKTEELQILLQKVNALKAEINQLTREINLSRDKLDTTRNSFLLAGEIKQKEIQTELEKISKYF